jgi:UDP-N-acetyl-D-mannosaminuronic acid dehydrogenase
MQSSFSTVSVIGLGYIGLPTAAVLAGRDIKVIGVDVSKKVVETINQGRIHIVEPDLDVVVRGAVNAGTLRAVLTTEPAEAFLIAVPTPVRHDDKAPDLSYIDAAARSIAPVLVKGNLVILESTSPVGTTERFVRTLSELRPDLRFPQYGESANPDVNVAYCPERVLPGQVLRELVENDRVIGGMTKHCAARARELYKTFVKGECIVTNARTAELVKLTENAFRDVNIAFANELSLICDELGINVWELRELANRHPRVSILTPGAGVGGHCIAVDPWFIVHSNPSTANLIRQARLVNDAKPHFVVSKVIEKSRKFRDPVIACLGLAFKPDIDDLRESPAIEIVHELAKKNVGKLIIVEPNVESSASSILGDAAKAVEKLDLSDALKCADIVVILVGHKEFRQMDRAMLDEKVVLDFVDALGRR